MIELAGFEEALSSPEPECGTVIRIRSMPNREFAPKMQT